MKKILGIINLTSGERKGKKLTSYIKSEFASRGYETELKTTEYAGHAIELASEAKSDEYEKIIVMGGDGTINEAAQGLLKSDLTHIPLAIIPTGVGNFIAKELRIKKRFFKALLVVITGKPYAFDVFNVKCSGVERILLGCIGVGFDSAIIEKFVKLRKGRAVSINTYASLISKMSFRKEWSPLKITVNGTAIDDRIFYWVVGMNTRVYGNGSIIFSPQADRSDGLLDIVGFEASVNEHKIRYFLGLRNGSILKNEWANLYKGRKLTIESEEESPVQADGEYAGKTPVEIEFTNRQIQIIGP